MERCSRKQFATVSAAVLLTLLLSTLAWGQVNSGTIYGSVSDASGARIPGATVVLTNEATGVQRQVTTDTQGAYLASALPVGRYTIRTSSSGFQSAEVKNLPLEVEQRREVNFTLQIATGAETIVVTAEAAAPLLESTVSSLGQVIQERSIVELPLNGRNFVQLGTLSPGAIKSEGGQFNDPAASTSVRGSTSLSVNGLRENANDWLLDGVDNNELTAGSISFLPSVDTIQEFKVLTSNYSAPYGRNGGGTILITTKSGSNSFHGTVYEFLRNDKLDARGFFDSKKPSFRQNQFGFTAGGPLKKDKLFIFGGYEGFRIRKGLTFISTVPTALARAGNFSEAGQPNVFDPCLTFDVPTQTCTAFVASGDPRIQFPGNIIPQDRLDPIALQVLDFFPLPNLPGLSNNFRHASKRELTEDKYNIRVDHTIGPNDTYFVRFSLDNTEQFFPGPLPGFGGGTSPFISATINEPRARNLAIVWNHVFSPHLINQAVAGFNRIFISVVGPSFGQGDLSAQLGIPGANQGDEFTSGLSRFNLAGFNGLGDRLTTPLVLGSNVFHYADNLTWIRGRHEMNLGFAIRYNQLNGTAYDRPRGDFSFDSLFTAQRSGGAFVSGTGSAVASLLLGLPASSARTNVFGGDVTGRRWEDYRFYFQDDWHVNPQLTINVGLAYMILTASTEVFNRYGNFDPTTASIPVAGVNASKTGNVDTDTNNFQPRIGFAYTPFKGRGFVVRGGYGIFNDWAQGGMTGLQVNPPFIDSPGFFSNSITPARLLRDGFPAPVQQDPDNPSGAVVFWDNNYKLGFVQQWNLTLQQELGWETVVTVAYVGSKADNLQDKNGNFNAPAPGAGAINPRRPFPNVAGIQLISSRGFTRYHGLQTKLEKRFSSNLYLLLGYTWSKGIGNEPSQNLTFQPNATGAVYFPFAPHGRDSDRGLNGNDLRHSFTLSYVYDLPMSDVGRLNHVVGGWQISGISRMRSGFPLGATITPSLLNNTMGNRPNVVCDPNLSSSERTVQRWFDNTCFTAPAAFLFGNSGRTFGTGPNQFNFDFSIFKRFQISEQVQLQFRTEIFNIFNTPQFGLPSTAIGTGPAGSITTLINDPRDIQFGLKLIF